ncbi:glycosyl transferase family 1 [bacterium (Candidatus Howlettbacteria) CG_4_10_14_0_8_um_filter_40_9]|nr:MAG: glycosyl transferase family 1 [bacterium (Candidatus Howlettbacteria) CG_4_10_14_0_8_um_filter_40_9]
MISVQTEKIELEDYRGIIDDELFDEIEVLAKELKGIRVCHINTTSYGGGVAEILHQEVPLANSLGLKVDWKTMKGSSEFFEVTKKIHNALQGADIHISEKEWQIYRSCNIDASKKIKPSDYDVFFIHDPQPALMLNCLARNGAKWVWRCHLDLSTPNEKVQKQIGNFLENYNAYIFTMKQYVFKNIKRDVHIIAPAIDPLCVKNRRISKSEARSVVESFGIDADKPLVTQVSRFDPWKDPKGVIDAYRIAKREIPGLQLALAASMADDDPEGEIVLKETREYAGADKDIFFLINLNKDYGDVAINALQTYSNSIIQKSIREGFGLTVAEALWKKTPVIGGNVGGIPMQIENGESGYLVNTSEECAEKIVYLLENKEFAKKMGECGREHIRKKFLLPRLLRDEMKVMAELLVAEKV